MPRRKSYFGKYRGQVASNLDPLQLGRVRVEVPDVLGTAQSMWALPCFPVTGSFLVPDVGAAVWVEFEQGDPTLPIWTGVYYSDPSELPQMARGLTPGTPAMVFEALKSGIRITGTADGHGMIEIAGPRGAMIVVRGGQVEILNGTGARISLTGPQADINNGALTIV